LNIVIKLAIFLSVGLVCAHAAEFRVADFGAHGDGKTRDTAAIQQALDAAAKAQGTVVFKPGQYLTGALFVKSGTHLRLDEGVELRGVQDLAAYPVMATRIAGIEMKWPAALLNVYQQSGVKISGKGAIDGDGKIWWDKYWTMRKDYEARSLRWAVDYDCMRPRLVQVFQSTDVEIQGLTLKRSGFWTVHICYSRKVKVDGLTIRNNIGGRGPSTDGIDVDSSSDVSVAHCDIECNDDAICLKAGRDADGLRVNRPTERVTIRDCTVRGGAGGITIGSETSGGIRDIDAAGIHVFEAVPHGIIFKSANTRGGTIENISIRDLDLHGVANPINMTLNWNPSYSYAKMPANIQNPPDYWKILTAPVAPERGLPHFRKVRIANIKAEGAKDAFSVNAHKESPLEDFEFRDVEIAAKSAGRIENAHNWRFVHTRIHTADGSRVTLKDSSGVVVLEESKP
jgi:polygalacturonase